MKILFVASELAPIAKVGGLGDVMEALPRALAKLGVEVSVIIPRYGFISRENAKLIAKDVVVPLAQTKEKISLYESGAPDSKVRVFLIENKTYWGHGSEPYFESTAIAEAKAEIQRFAFFSKAVFTLIAQGFLKADIVHCNDWHTGALVALLADQRRHSTQTNAEKSQRKSASSPRESAIRPKVVLTIHNLSNQGKWNAKEIDSWFFAKNEKTHFTKLGKDYNFIAEGILYADRVTTVSPSYTKEILTKKYGEGLEKILEKRKRHLTGILNGIDYDFWNPETDKFVFKNYSAQTVQKVRTENKIALQTGLGLKEDLNTPLFGLVSRLTPQKGIDFITAIAEKFIEKYDSQFVFLGKGAKEYEDSLTALAKKFPKSIYAKIGFDEQLAHRIYAASDFFLMPSRFEPSGLGQMISMRYGTIPIVRATGGLKDSVKHRKTGIVFEKESSSAFRKALELARQMYSEEPKKIQAIQAAGFRMNFDFSKSAAAYKHLYDKLL